MRQTNRRRQQNSTAKAALSRLKSSLHGHANTLNALDPSATNRRPYHSLVVQQTILSNGQSVGIPVSDLVKRLLDQLGMAAQDATIVNVKLKRCDVWAVSKANSSVRPAVNADYSSLVPTIADPTSPGNAIVAYPLLKRLEDIGGVSSSARVSYTWPLSMSDIPLNKNADFVLITVASNVTEIDIRWHLDWSTADIQEPTA